MFDFDYWWVFILPVAFALGWAAARVDIKHLLSESRALPRSYFQGLNFLLNEQPDKAIDAFVEVVRVDPETIELHFALGNLFRRRGETERAIRMHQNLVNRADLSEEQRLHALYELGQDFLGAGLLDRAEETLNKLRGTAYEDRARRFLLDIYQLEKDWDKAADCARALEAQTGLSRQREIGQFYCEIATRELMRSNHAAARTALEAALGANRLSVRAQVLLGDLHMQLGETTQAVEAWQRVEQQDPKYLSLVVQKLIEAYRKLDQIGAGLTLIKGYLERYPSLDLLDAAFTETLQAEGVEAAYKLVRDELKRNPTLLGLDHLLEAQIINAPTPEKRSDLELVRNLVHTHTQRLARYACESCGFKARQFHWRCPGCGAWESYPPKRSEEFNLAP